MRDARVVMHVRIANPRWRGKRSPHSRRMHNPLFYVCGKRPIIGYYGAWLHQQVDGLCNQLAEANTDENIKAPITGHLWGEFQECENRFHDMTSSCRDTFPMGHTCVTFNLRSNTLPHMGNRPIVYWLEVDLHKPVYAWYMPSFQCLLIDWQLSEDKAIRYVNRKCQDYVYIKWEYYVENKALFETWKSEGK